ncbi:conjugal transfer protein [Pectobacterium atrosepticum ICMP 1526]|uniref:virB8 family protein n=1 Tax=Pectobacterium atrosepticum TaxID=29471 RepID=UPI000507E5E8|nr:type IV secretion system protein [Pectobacterium atrosepticum]KFX10704.1 conjugal transfer protein TraG [Pectobacterium atrosepticum]KMK87268.1 conjugal transfer protein [Pectobacterium atrosepticum ICMP 1526]
MDVRSLINRKLDSSERKEIFNENKSVTSLTASDEKVLLADKSAHDKSVRGFQKDRSKEQKNLMWIGFGFGCIGMIAAGSMAIALAKLTPLKEVKPYIVSIDSVTGSQSVTSAIGDDKIKISYQSLMDGSNVANFVIERESYDWNSIQNNLDKVKLRSKDHVYESMRREIVESKNSPLVLLDKSKLLKVGVLSFPFVDSDKGVATVRFYKAVTDDTGKLLDGYPVTYWQATITFDYEHNLVTAQDRVSNPLGFNVTSYRADQEVQK